MKSLFARFVKDQSGATAIEYGLIAALIAVVMITAVTSVGTKVSCEVHGHRRQPLSSPLSHQRPRFAGAFFLASLVEFRHLRKGQGRCD